MITIEIRKTTLIVPDFATKYNPSFGPGGNVQDLGDDED